MSEVEALAYFDTPERAERLELVAHLLRNTDQALYLRGPAGAGKSRFAARLAEDLGDEVTLVALDGTHCADVPATVSHALGITVGDWPQGALDASAAGGLVVLVDDAEALGPESKADLLALQAGGGRLVLLGRADPAELFKGWAILLIDLPPLSVSQARDFLMLAGRTAVMQMSDGELHALYQQTGGHPGPLLDSGAADGGSAAGPMPAGSPWKWVLGGVIAILVILVLSQQERINALFSPATTPPQVAAPVEATPDDTATEGQIAIPPMAPAPTPAPSSVKPVDTQAAVPGEPTPENATEQPEPAALTDAAMQQLAEPSAEPVAPLPMAPVSQPLSDMAQIPEVVAEPTPTPTPILVPEAPAKIVRAPTAQHGEPVVVEPMTLDAPARPVSKPAAPAAPAAPKPTAQAPSLPAKQDDLSWLRGRQSKHYTLQLLGARDRASINEYIKAHRLQGNYAIFMRDLNGKPWYSLVYGDYPDRDAALRGRAALPTGLRDSDIWPRTFASVQEQLPAAPAPR